MSQPSKEPKEAVDYSPGHKNSHCGPTSGSDTGYCKHFYEREALKRPAYTRSGYCQKVAGVIRRPYWCRLWAKHESA